MKAGILIAIAILAVLPWFLPAYAMQVAIQASILAIFAMSFNLLFHHTGLLSFGHAAFFGAGGYATALAVSKLGWPYWSTLPLAIAGAAVTALIIGFFSVRLSKIYFTMLTLAFAQILWAVAHRWYSFTGGDNGITGLQPTGVLGTAKGLYYLGMAVLIVVSLVLYMVLRSPAGYTLRALRDNPARAQAIGIGAFEYMLAGFVLSGTFSGLAGFLHVAWQRSAFPDVFFWTTSAGVIIATILGGSSFFLGPIVGAAVFVIAQALVLAHTHYWPMALGIILLALVLFFPGGVVGLFYRQPQRQEQDDAAA